MEQKEAWQLIDDQRRAIVRMLEALSEQEWEQPSLCDGWTIRQVAAHLALQNVTWTMMPQAVAAAVRHRGMNGAIQAMAVRHAVLPASAIIGEITERIGVHRPLPTVTFRESAIDYVVHAQDIAIPLGRDIAAHPGLAALAADRLWATSRMFHARKKLAGYRLAADDIGWAVGQGQEVRGNIIALLLLLTGRPAALRSLSGPGVASLRAVAGAPAAA